MTPLLFRPLLPLLFDLVTDYELPGFPDLAASPDFVVTDFSEPLLGDLLLLVFKLL